MADDTLQELETYYLRLFLAKVVANNCNSLVKLISLNGPNLLSDFFVRVIAVFYYLKVQVVHRGNIYRCVSSL